jgi:hypothetical protein
MHADHAYVRVGIHRPRRQVLVERQVGPPRLIDDQRLAPPVADLGDTRDVGAGAVRAGADDERARGVGVLLPRLLDLLRGGWMRDVPFGVPARRDPAGLHPGEDQTRHDGLVTVPTHQEAAVAARDGHHRGLHRKRTAAGGEPRDVGAHGRGHQVLRMLQVFVAGPAVIEATAGQHVVEERVPAQHRQHPVIRAAALSVSRRREAVPILAPIVVQRLQQGSLRLVHSGGLPAYPRLSRIIREVRLAQRPHRPPRAVRVRAPPPSTACGNRIRRTAR